MTDAVEHPAPVEEPTSPRSGWTRLGGWLALIVVVGAGLLSWWLYHVSYQGAPLQITVEVHDNRIVGRPDDQKTCTANVSNWKTTRLTFEPIGVDFPFAVAPPAYDNLRITRLSTGEVLYENDFSDGVGDLQWENESRKGSINEYGQLVLRENSGAVLNGVNFVDVKIELEAFNNRSTMITGWDHDQNRRFEYLVRHLPDYDQRLQIKSGRGTIEHTSARSYLLPLENGVVEFMGRNARFTLSALAMLGGGLVVALFVHLWMLALGWLWQRLLRETGRSPEDLQATRVGRFVSSARETWTWSWPKLALIASIAVAGWLTTTLAHIADDYIERIPHVQDSVCYLFQANKYALGHIALPEPPEKEAFAMQFMLYRNDQWYSIYPFGWPGLLMFGVLAGAPWLVNPIVTGINVVLVYLVGRVAFGSSLTGLIGAGLLAASPFTIWLGGSYMGHSAATLYQVGGVLFLILALQRYGFLAGAMSGLMIGLAFNTRPMNGVAMVAACVPFFIYVWIRERETDRWRHFRGFLGLAAGGIAMFLAFLAFNWATSGSPLVMPYSQYHDQFTQIRPQFGPIEYWTVARQIMQFTTLYNGMLTVAYFNWPVEWIWTTFAFLVLPVLTLKARRYDTLLFLVILFTYLLYAPYPNKVLIFGPRYYFEIMFAVFLLSARGIVLAGEWCRDMLAVWFRMQPGNAPAYVVQAILIGFMAGNVEANLDQFLNSKPYWGEKLYSFMPRRLADLKGFNYIEPHIQNKMRDAGITDTHIVVFVDEQGTRTWYRYGSVFHQTDPLFRDNHPIYAREIDDATRKRVMALFPGRRYFRVTYRKTGDVEEIFPDNRTITLGTTPDQPEPTPDAPAGEAPERVATNPGFRNLAVRREEIAVADLNMATVTILDQSGQKNWPLNGVTFGEEAVPFQRPGAVAIGYDGNIAVVDWGAQAIYRMTRTGRGLARIDAEKLAQVSGFGDVAFTAGGTLIATAPWDGGIAFFAGNGVLRSFMTSEDGAFDEPLWVATEPERNRLYFTDNASERIVILSPEGDVEKVITPGGWPENPWAMNPLSVDPGSAGLYHYLPERGQIEVYDWKGALSYAFPFAPGDPLMGYSSMAVATISKGAHVYLVDRATGKLEISKLPLATNAFRGGRGNDLGEFQFPRAVTTDKAGNIYVVDRELNRLQVFDGEGEFLRTWGETHPQEFGKLQRPFGVEIDSDGRVFVANGEGSYVNWFTPEGEFIGVARTNFNFRMYAPFDIDFDGDNRLYVTNAGHRCIHVLRPEQPGMYAYEFSFGEEGSEPGQFTGDPMSTTIDEANDRIITSDRESPRLQVFNKAGDVITEWTIAHKDYNDIMTYRSDAGKSYYIITRYAARVLILDDEGQPIGPAFDPDPAVQTGQFGPLCIDRSNGDVIMADKSQARLVRVPRAQIEAFIAEHTGKPSKE